MGRVAPRMVRRNVNRRRRRIPPIFLRRRSNRRGSRYYVRRNRVASRKVRRSYGIPPNGGGSKTIHKACIYAAVGQGINAVGAGYGKPWQISKDFTHMKQHRELNIFTAMLSFLQLPRHTSPYLPFPIMSRNFISNAIVRLLKYAKPPPEPLSSIKLHIAYWNCC